MSIFGQKVAWTILGIVLSRHQLLKLRSMFDVPTISDGNASDVANYCRRPLSAYYQDYLRAYENPWCFYKGKKGEGVQNECNIPVCGEQPICVPLSAVHHFLFFPRDCWRSRTHFQTFCNDNVIRCCRLSRRDVCL